MQPPAQRDPYSGAEPFTAKEVRVFLTWFLLIGGVLLVISADALGNFLVTDGHSWNPEKARSVALTLRFLGGMGFMAGLVERVLMHFSNPQS